MTPGLWYHVAFVRQSGTNRIYLNGVQYASNTNMPITNASQVSITVGCGSYNNPQWVYERYMSDLRIVKGTAVILTELLFLHRLLR